MVNKYFIKSGYQSREQIEYFEDRLDVQRGVVHQPFIYPLAAHLGRHLGCSHIIDIGCGQGRKLAELHPEFQLVGLDFGQNIAYCQEHYHFGQWIEIDLDKYGTVLPLTQEIVANAVIVCADVIEHLHNPDILLEHIYQLLEHAPIAVLTTPDRDALRGKDDMGPPRNPHHVREWCLEELVQYVRSKGITVEHYGHTINNNLRWEKTTSLLILGKNERPPIAQAPTNFRVVAIMTAYNEADIIVQSLAHLIAQGVEVYVIDNWSTDGTYELAKSFVGRGAIAVERFPHESDGNKHMYNWIQLLARVEEVALEVQADWFIHHDADELRESPWPDVSLRDAIYYVDRCGFNSIDHTIVNYLPGDDTYTAGDDPRKHLLYYEFGKRLGYFKQIKGWKNTGSRIALKDSGGHHVRFDGQRVYPYKFLIKHYPLRTREQTLRKVAARQKNANPHERARGWHIMYDHLDTRNGSLFEQLCRETRATHTVFDAATFYTDFLVERLTGIGLQRQKRPFLKGLKYAFYHRFAQGVRWLRRRLVINQS